jgi:hypothetical protein
MFLCSFQEQAAFRSKRLSGASGFQEQAAFIPSLKGRAFPPLEA